MSTPRLPLWLALAVALPACDYFIAPGNKKPIGGEQALSTLEDTPLALALSATDEDSFALAHRIVSGPSQGTLSGTGAAQVYTPNPNYHGRDSFAFVTNDGKNDSEPTTVEIVVNAVPDPPLVEDQLVSVDKNVARAIALVVSDPDGDDAFTYSVVAAPSHGVLTGTAPIFTFTPATNYVGTDSFTLRASDGTSDSKTATITLVIGSNNTAPLSSDQTVSTNEDTAKVISLGSVDPEGDTLSYRVVNEPSHGTLVGSGASWTYTPSADWNGTDSFTFRSNDATVDSNLATVSVVVVPVNDAPVIGSIGAASTNEDASQGVDFTITDIDSLLTCSATHLAMTSGTTSVVASASVVWSGTAPDCTATITPVANAYGASTLALSVSDGALSATSSFDLTVHQVGDDALTDNSWPFDALSEALYTFNATLIQFTSGVAELVGFDQRDDSASEFHTSSGAQLSGLVYGTLSDGASGLKLGNDGTCNGTTSPCANQAAAEIYELHSSWTPQWNALVSYWKLDGNWNDAKGANHLASAGTAAFSAVSKLGAGAGSFDGSGSASTAAAVTDLLAGSNDYTVSVWINPAAVQIQYADIFDYGHCAETNFVIQQDSLNMNRFAAGYRRNDGTWATGISLDAAPAGVWSQLVFVKNGAVVYGYINGVLNKTGLAETTAVIAKSAQRVTIGGNLVCGGRQFTGKIDDVAVWSAPLSSADIQAIYDRQSAKYSGAFLSRVMDGGAGGSSWTTLSWRPTLPFFKELPDAACAGATCAHINNESSGDYSSLVGSTGLTGADDLMSGIAGLWHHNESSWNGTAGEVKDASGKGNHGTAVNGASPISAGKMKGAGSFDGSSHHVLGSISGSTVFAGDFTISAWINHRALTQWGAIFSNSVGTNDTPILTMRDSTTQIGMMRVGVVDSGVFVDLGADHYNKWIFVSLRRSGGTLHVDAWKDGTKISNSGALSWALNTTNSYYIGRHYQPGTQIFNGLIDEVVVWSRALSNVEINQLYQRGASRLKYQVRTCDDDACSGETWKGPDGTSGTFFSEINNNSVPLDASGVVKPTLPSMLFSAFTSPPAANRYFQYRTIFETDSASVALGPELKSVTVDPVHYPLEAAVSGNNGVPFYELTSLTQSLGAGDCTSGVVYNLALSNTGPWKYWNGSAWVTANGTEAHANSAATFSSQLSSFGAQVGRGNVYFKAFLRSSGQSKCELSNLLIDGAK